MVLPASPCCGSPYRGQQRLHLSALIFHLHLRRLFGNGQPRRSMRLATRVPRPRQPRPQRRRYPRCLCLVFGAGSSEAGGSRTPRLTGESHGSCSHWRGGGGSLRSSLLHSASAGNQDRRAEKGKSGLTWRRRSLGVAKLPLPKQAQRTERRFEPTCCPSRRALQILQARAGHGLPSDASPPQICRRRCTQKRWSPFLTAAAGAAPLVVPQVSKIVPGRQL